MRDTLGFLKKSEEEKKKKEEMRKKLKSEANEKYKRLNELTYNLEGYKNPHK